MTGGDTGGPRDEPVCTQGQSRQTDDEQQDMRCHPRVVPGSLRSTARPPERIFTRPPLTQPCALNAPGVVEIDVDNYPQEDALRKLL